MRETYAGILCASRDTRGERSVRGLPSVEAVRRELLGGRDDVPSGFHLSVWRERTGDAVRGEVVLELDSAGFAAKARRRKRQARKEQARRKVRERNDPAASPVMVEAARLIRAYLERRPGQWVSVIEIQEALSRRIECATRTIKRAGRSLELETRFGRELGHVGNEGRRMYWRLPVVEVTSSVGQDQSGEIGS